MERGREPPDAEGEDVVAPDAGVGDALAVLIGDDEAREDRLLHRGARRAAARRGGVRRDGVAGVGGKGGVIALRVVTGDGAVEAGEDLLAVHVADSRVALARLGNDGHFALDGDFSGCVAHTAADACAAGDRFASIVYIRHAAGRVHSGRAALIALDGDLVAVAVIFVVFCVSTTANASRTYAAGGVDCGVSFDSYVC